MELKFILLPVIAGIITQITKLIIDAIHGKFSWTDLNSYGGMPSAHAAFVTALFASIGYYEGWTHPATAIAFVLAIIVMRDAAGYRRVIGRHAEELNNLIHNLPGAESYKFAHLKERIGHTPLQIIIGTAIGVLVVVISSLIF